MGNSYSRLIPIGWRCIFFLDDYCLLSAEEWTPLKKAYDQIQSDKLKFLRELRSESEERMRRANLLHSA